MFKRAYDARKTSAIQLIYTIDAAVKDEAGVLKRLARDRQIGVTPDMAYRHVARAPAGSSPPVVVGLGPCGLFAGLILAEMGFKPIILERGKIVRERDGRHVQVLAEGASSIRRRMPSSAKAARAHSRTANSTARSRTPTISVGRC